MAIICILFCDGCGACRAATAAGPVAAEQSRTSFGLPDAPSTSHWRPIVVLHGRSPATATRVEAAKAGDSMFFNRDKLKKEAGIDMDAEDAAAAKADKAGK